MKSYMLLLMLVISAAPALLAQEEQKPMQTLLGDKSLVFSGYGGPRVGLSKFNNSDIWLVGGRGGLMINHVFVIGGAGYGIVNSPEQGELLIDGVTYSKLYLEGGYGGLHLEYIVKPHKLVHLSFPLLIGGGNLSYTERSIYTEPRNEIQAVASCAFFAIEPGVELELNVTQFMRLTAGLTYRYAHSLNLPATSNGAFNGLTGALSLKFGGF